MEEIEIFLRLAFAGFSIILSALTAVSWFRAREPKVLLAAAGFGILAVEGILLAAGIFMEGAEALNTTPNIVAMNLAALVLIYFSILKR